MKTFTFLPRNQQQKKISTLVQDVEFVRLKGEKGSIRDGSVRNALKNPVYVPNPASSHIMPR